MRAAKFAFAFCALSLAGCNDYYDHREALTPYSGEAIAANRVAQMVDPWPASSASPRFGHNGERMQRAIANYKGGVVPTSSSSTSSGAGNGEQSNNGSESADKSGSEN